MLFTHEDRTLITSLIDSKASVEARIHIYRYPRHIYVVTAHTVITSLSSIPLHVSSDTHWYSLINNKFRKLKGRPPLPGQYEWTASMKVYPTFELLKLEAGYKQTLSNHDKLLFEMELEEILAKFQNTTYDQIPKDTPSSQAA